jgi:hypothetical protein
MKVQTLIEILSRRSPELDVVLYIPELDYLPDGSGIREIADVELEESDHSDAALIWAKEK